MLFIKVIFILRKRDDFMLNILDSNRNVCCFYWVVFVFYRKKSGKLKVFYKRDCFSFGSNVDIDFFGLIIYGWVVLVFEGWFVGY